MTIRKTIAFTFWSLFLGMNLSHVAAAQSEGDFRKKHYNLDKSQLAIQGYDPVAYFTQQKAVKGNPQHNFRYQGVVYHFATDQHLEAFKKDPARYEPAYGGWCAYAMGATGEKVEIDPETFKVNNGKLYLFYNKYFNNTLPKWNKDEANLKQKADQHWNAFIQ